jgi:hypothetical protein
MVRSCITFAGTRVDQLVAIEVLEALRPLGVLSSFRIADHSPRIAGSAPYGCELPIGNHHNRM